MQKIYISSQIVLENQNFEKKKSSLSSLFTLTESLISGTRKGRKRFLE